MKFLILAIATLVTFATAAPVAKPEPEAVPEPFPTGIAIVTPKDLSQYTVSTGAINYRTADGLVRKTGNGRDITTLITFDIPAAAVGKTLVFHFITDTSSTVTGSGLLDVYTSLQPATASTTTWPPGNQRNNHVGRLSLVKSGGGEATYLAGYPTTARAFAAPSTAGAIAFEVVGVWDADQVAWNGAISGAYLSY